MSILLIDNYDSFTYNLYQCIGKLTSKRIIVWRNDEKSVDDVIQLNPTFIVLSPGPGHPENKRDFGICGEILQKLSPRTPTLGICLGHQGIASFYSEKVSHAKKIFHGKTSKIFHTGTHLFFNIPSPFSAARYHSLAIQKLSKNSCLSITAMSEDDEIMGVKHKDFPIFGVQFHPESIISEFGLTILKNFLNVKINFF